MWGTWIRAAVAGGVGAIFAAILAFFLATMIPTLESGAEDAPAAAQTDMVIGFFASVQEWFALVVLVSIAVLVLGRAVLENQFGSGGVR